MTENVRGRPERKGFLQNTKISDEEKEQRGGHNET